jgi:hypothetical protein
MRKRLQVGEDKIAAALSRMERLFDAAKALIAGQSVLQPVVSWEERVPSSTPPVDSSGQSDKEAHNNSSPTTPEAAIGHSTTDEVSVSSEGGGGD